jgi:hypothetical protein
LELLIQRADLSQVDFPLLIERRDARTVLEVAELGLQFCQSPALLLGLLREEIERAGDAVHSGVSIAGQIDHFLDHAPRQFGSLLLTENGNHARLFRIRHAQPLAQFLNRLVTAAVRRQGIEFLKGTRRRPGCVGGVGGIAVRPKNRRWSQIVDDSFENHPAAQHFENRIEFVLAQILNVDRLPGRGRRIERDAFAPQADEDLGLRAESDG